MSSLAPATIVFAAAGGDHIKLIVIIVIILAVVGVRHAVKRHRRHGAGDDR